jgi:hypothetical protein
VLGRLSRADREAALKGLQLLARAADVHMVAGAGFKPLAEEDV